MTTFREYRERTRDIQDGSELQMWGELEYVDGAGAVMKVRGTGTTDQDVPVLNSGYGFNVPSDYNCEVLVVSMGSDTSLKMALPTIPRDQQRQWASGHGGVQHPTNPDIAVQFEGESIRLTFAGNSLLVSEGGGGLVLQSTSAIDFQCPTLTHNGINIGDDHAHDGVLAGGAITGGPVS